MVGVLDKGEVLEVKASVLKRVIGRGQAVLQAKGLVAIDGSGDKDVECLLTYLKLFRVGRVRVLKEE